MDGPLNHLVPKTRDIDGTGWCYHLVVKVLEPFHPPQTYRYEDDLVLMLELISGHLPTGIFEVDR